MDNRIVAAALLACTLGQMTGMAAADEFLLDVNFTYQPCPGDQELPAVGFDGTNWLVVWRDHASGQHDILGARVSADGDVLDSAYIAVATDSGPQDNPAVCSDGTNWLVVWQDGTTGNTIRGARIAPEGTVLDLSLIHI